VAERFPLYTEAGVHQPLIKALRERGWDIVRAIHAGPERTEDNVHFEYAARENRISVGNDRRGEVVEFLQLAAPEIVGANDDRMCSERAKL
jgi:hypothetical protein